MKILFCGPTEDFSGFAWAARNFLHSLVECKDFDVVSRPLRYDQLDEEQSIEKAEWRNQTYLKDLNNIDMLIQMTTSNTESVPKQGVCNALYSFFETDRLQPAWAQKAQSFDFLIVPCKANAEALLHSGITRPIIVIPPPCDIDIYRKEYSPLNIPKAEGRTIFYNICQLSAKKGIDALIRSYYAAFADRPNEVLLVLKTYIGMAGRNNKNEMEQIKQFINRVRQGCRLPIQEYPPILPLIGTLSQEDIYRLHTKGDVYVNSSRAEGWNIPAFESIALGKTLISNACGGMADWVSNNNALVYNTVTSLCYDFHHPDPSLYIGVEQVFEPSTAEMASLMRTYHLLKTGEQKNELDENNKQVLNAIKQRTQNGRYWVAQYDYRIVSKLIADQLKAAHVSWKENGQVILKKEVKTQ